MTIVFSIFLVVFVLVLFLFYVRKSQWDTIHRNLLDLEDHFEGKVIRRGFAARPFFHGKVMGFPFTLNISTEKLANQRMVYVDITWDIATRQALTISNNDWLKRRGDEQPPNSKVISTQSGKKFIFIHEDEKRLQHIAQHPVVQEFLTQFENLCFLFMGKTGLICEFSTENLAKATEFEGLNRRLQLIKKLGDVLKQ